MPLDCQIRFVQLIDDSLLLSSASTDVAAQGEVVSELGWHVDAGCRVLPWPANLLAHVNAVRRQAAHFSCQAEDLLVRT
jgi:hypothetical protein